MRLKTIFIAIISALTAIILYKNNEASSFWLFGTIYTSKLIILLIFYILGIITGGILFRRKNKHAKEYSISVIKDQEAPEYGLNQEMSGSNLSQEDKEYIRND